MTIGEVGTEILFTIPEAKAYTWRLWTTNEGQPWRSREKSKSYVSAIHKGAVVNSFWLNNDIPITPVPNEN